MASAYCLQHAGLAVLLTAALLVVCSTTNASGEPPSDAGGQASQAPAASATPTAKPEDVASVDAILASLYDVISGPAGQKRDWDRMRSLFIPEGRLIAVGRRPDGQLVRRVMSPDDYIASSGKFVEENGFFEREIARTTESFGNIVHVFSTYEARKTAEDPKPFMRGINSIQLMNDGTRWWVVTVFWQAEDPKTPLPEKYLP